MSYNRISACGLDCPQCDLYKLPTDKSIQDRFIPDFRAKGWLKENEGLETILAKGMYCKGCNVDKKAFWSEGACDIVACCKDTKKLANCTECGEFPCPKVAAFSAKGGKYKDAIDILTGLKNRG